MAVLAVIAIMSALIIPEMRGTLDDALLRSSARQLVHACELANSRAIALNEPQRLRLVPATGRYYIEAATDRAEPSPPPSSQPMAGRNRTPVEGVLDARVTVALGRAHANKDGDAEPASTQPDPADEVIPPDPNALSFQPDGTASGPEILLRDRAGYGLALRVHPVTARMRLIELPRQ